MDEQQYKTGIDASEGSLLRPSGEPGHAAGLFFGGSLAGTVFAPLVLFFFRPGASGPPGFDEGWPAVGLDVLILAAAAAIASFSFVFGRAVRRRLRRPRFRTAPSSFYLAAGAAVPCLFLWLSRGAQRLVQAPGLLWFIGIGGPFLLGVFTAPRGVVSGGSDPERLFRPSPGAGPDEQPEETNR